VNELLAAGGGFLLAVLWMDLIFDVQVLRHRGETGPLPEPVLASIAAYYKRATTDSRPMSRLIALAMAVVVVGSAWDLVASGDRKLARAAALALCLAPAALAGLRIVPDAVRLGTRKDDSAQQSALARGICLFHVACFAAIAAFLALRVAL